MNITDALKTDIAHNNDMFKTPAGDIGTISGLSNYLQALFHRLVTVPGSLAHRPLYGVGVGRFQNGLNSFTIQQKLASLIVDQFMQDPRTQSVTSVAIVVDDLTPEMTRIKCLVVPVGYTEQTVTFTPFNLGLVA